MRQWQGSSCGIAAEGLSHRLGRSFTVDQGSIVRCHGMTTLLECGNVVGCGSMWAECDGDAMLVDGIEE
eukprot:14450076-Ditylum_brightwellii.AAC.1